MGESCDEVATIKTTKLYVVKAFYNSIYQVIYKFKKNSKPVIVFATQREKKLGENLRQLKNEISEYQNDFYIKEICYRKETDCIGKINYFYQGIVSTYWLGKSDTFIIDDYFFPVYCVKKKSGTRVVQLWHALGTFKKFGHALISKKHKVVEPHVNYDYVFINNEEDRQAYHEAFLVANENIHAVGMTLANNRMSSKKIYSHSLRSERLILYAPTYRFSQIDQVVNLINRFIDEIKLVDNDQLIVSLHPYISKKNLIKKKGVTFIFNAQETDAILKDVDVLITDYSSIIYNFSKLKRHILFYAPDYYNYRMKNGFFIDWIEKSGQSEEVTSIVALNKQLMAMKEQDNYDFSFIDDLRRAAKPAYVNNNEQIIRKLWPELI